MTHRLHARQMAWERIGWVLFLASALGIVLSIGVWNNGVLAVLCALSTVWWSWFIKEEHR